MKGAGKKVITMFLSLLLFCSFSFPVYAASDYFDPELYNYGDSYINSVSTEDRSLFFLPLIPESQYPHYMIIYRPSEDCYYLYLMNRQLWNAAEFYGGSFIDGGYDLYKFSRNSNDWELVMANVDYYYGFYHFGFPDYVPIDCTCNIVKAVVSSGGDVEVSYVNKTGYRIYWLLSVITKQVLSYLLSFSDYILGHVFLRFAFLIFFAGEVLLFVVMLIRRIGELKYE